MGIDAVAVLHLPFEEITRELTPHDEAAGTYRSPTGAPVLIVAAADATLVHTLVRFGSEPDELGLALRLLLGDLVDRHPDERGIFVFPDVAEPKARSYHEVLDEIGEAGFWVPRVPADHVPKRIAQAEPGSLEAAVRDMMAALPPGAMADLHRAAVGIDPATMAKAAEQLQAALGGREGELMAAIEQSLGAARQLLENTSPGHDEGRAPDLAALPFNIPDEQQAPELWRTAREQAEAMLQQNPERLAELARKLGVAPPDAGAKGPQAPGTPNTPKKKTTGG